MLELSLTILIWLIIIIIVSSILIYALSFITSLVLMVIAKVKGDKEFNDFSERVDQQQKEFKERAKQLALLKQFRKLIDYKLTLHQGSSMYREYRSKLDQLGVK